MTDDGDSQDGTVATESEQRVYRTTHDFEGRRALSTTVIEAIE